MITCSVCKQRVLRHACCLHCSVCEAIIHLKCLPLVSASDSIYTERETNNWICVQCLNNNLPFNHISDDAIFLESISEYWWNFKRVPYARLQEMVFNPFELNHDNPNLPNFDSDPDLQYFNDMTYIDNTSNCSYYLEEEFVKKLRYSRTNSQSFSILHTNIRSIPKNLEELEKYLSLLHYEFTVIGISETWLNESNVSQYCIPNYRHEYLCRQSGKKGGGVSLFVKTGIDFTRRHDLTFSENFCECLFVEISMNSFGISKNSLIAVIYRPPNTDLQKFNDKISEVLNNIKNENKDIYVVGDFNVNLLESDVHLLSAEFLETMYSFGLFPLINKPTRVNITTATLIDNIFTNNVISNDIVNGIFFVEISDHFPVFSITSHVQQNDSEPKIKSRDHSKRNIDKFTAELRNANWGEVLATKNGKDAFDLFFSEFSNLYHKSFPLKAIKPGYLNKKPWLSEGLKNSIKRKNMLYLKASREKTRDQLDRYKTYKVALKKILSISERKHYEELLEKYKTNSRKLWSIIKDVINKKKTRTYPAKFTVNGALTDDKFKIANNFNQYFINVGKILADKIPKTRKNPLDYISNCNDHTIVLESTDQVEIKKTVVSLKDSSPGWDGIQAKIIKQTYQEYLDPLTHICNLSLSQGFFPSNMKIAKVIPLFKSNDSTEISNYRPVSILPVFSKILEKLFYDRLLSFLNKHNTLYKYQFGFRKQHSTNMALMILIDNIVSAIDKGEIVVGVFLDFRKAFDTVDHDILLQKLYKLGIRGVANDWIKEYLHKRTQFVSFNNCESRKEYITFGVPQGSILGPLLFLLYINDISNVSDLLLPLIFADDTNIFIRGKSVDDTIRSMNREMCKIVAWLNANKLSLNIEKTHFMIFSSPRRRIVRQEEVMISGKTVKYTEETKFIGVVLDSKLKWDKQISILKTKIARGIGILIKARKALSHSTLITLYYSFIYPHYTYCIEVWGKAADVYINSIWKLQKRIIRIITSSQYRAETNPLYKKLNFLKLSSIYSFQINIFLFKFIKGMLPEIFDNLFERNMVVSVRNTRHKYKLRVPIYRLNISQNTIRFQGVKEWNSVGDNIDHYCSLHTFKKRLKQYFIEQQ